MSQSPELDPKIIIYIQTLWAYGIQVPCQKVIGDDWRLFM